MRSFLQVYDVSGFIHSAQNVTDYASRYAYKFPVGGIQYLMKHITSDLASYKDVVLCFDGGRSFRKDINKGYKAGRIPNKAVWAQLDLLYQVLPQCGIVCHKVDSFEADDMIFNTIENNRGENDYQNIEILGCDYDLTHNIVADNISFHSINSLTNCVSWYDFNSAIVKGEDIMRNTISAYKVWCGDNSDKLPAFVSRAKGIHGINFYRKYKEVIRTQGSNLSLDNIRGKALLNLFIENLGDYLNDEDRMDLERRIKLVYPVRLAEYDEQFKNVTTRSSVNLNALVDFLCVINDRTSLKTMGKYYSTPPENLVKLLKSRGDALISGEYAVDNNRPISDMSVNTEIINLKSF